MAHKKRSDLDVTEIAKVLKCSTGYVSMIASGQRPANTAKAKKVLAAIKTAKTFKKAFKKQLKAA